MRAQRDLLPGLHAINELGPSRGNGPCAAEPLHGEQIVAVLREHDAGLNTAESYCKHDTSDTILRKWKVKARSTLTTWPAALSSTSASLGFPGLVDWTRVGKVEGSSVGDEVPDVGTEEALRPGAARCSRALGPDERAHPTRDRWGSRDRAAHAAKLDRRPAWPTDG